MVILDWMMPGMDGLEVLHRVRALPTDRPPYILMLTANSGKRDIITGLDAGANDYLTKPFDAEILRARLDAGYEVAATCASGEDAVAYLQDSRVDVVLMDIGLAGDIDGVAAADEIRTFSAVPIVFMTGYAGRAHEQSVIAIQRIIDYTALVTILQKDAPLCMELSCARIEKETHSPCGR